MIEKKSKDQETKVGVRIIGSIIIALSGLILFSDKVLSFELNNNYGFSDTQTFLWVLSQSLSPFLLILATVFKPYKTSYLIPIYIYSIQIFWVFKPEIKFDDALLQTYAVGALVFYILLIYFIARINELKSKKEKEQLLFNKEVLETLELLKEKN